MFCADVLRSVSAHKQFYWDPRDPSVVLLAFIKLAHLGYPDSLLSIHYILFTILHDALVTVIITTHYLLCD